MTVDEALNQGLLALLRAAPLSPCGRFRDVMGTSPSEGSHYAAILFERTGDVRVRGPLRDDGLTVAAVWTVPDDLEWRDPVRVDRE